MQVNKHHFNSFKPNIFRYPSCKITPKITKPQITQNNIITAKTIQVMVNQIRQDIESFCNTINQSLQIKSIIPPTDEQIAKENQEDGKNPDGTKKRYFTWSGGECGSCSSLDGETFEEGSEPGSQHINCHCSLTETDKNGKPIKKSNGQEQENPETKEPAPYIYRAKEELENRLISTKYQAVDSTHPKPHTGVDIRAPEGTPIKAVRDGKVLLSGPQDPNDLSKGLGYRVRIQSDYKYSQFYGHMADMPIVNAHDYIKKGDILGYVKNLLFHFCKQRCRYTNSPLKVRVDVLGVLFLGELF